MYNFDAKKVTQEVIGWIRQFYEENGKDCNAIIGISGGKDSSVTAGLCVAALGKDRVIGVLMPNGEQSDLNMAELLVNHLGIQAIRVNINKGFSGIIGAIDSGHCYNGYHKKESTVQTTTNLPPRLRMATLYAVSQSNNGRVVNTCNLSEDWVGYSTRYGDAAGDFSPLAHLTVTEVKAIGRELGLPLELVEKAPSDGLCGKTDEDNLGFTYAVLDNYLRTGVCEDDSIRKLIDEKHRMNKFKMELMPTFEFLDK